MGRNKILDMNARLRIAVKMEIYLEKKIAAQPKRPFIEVIEEEYAKYDKSPRTYLTKMILDWAKYADAEKFNRYLKLVIDQKASTVEIIPNPGQHNISKGIVVGFPICFGFPALCDCNYPYKDNVYTAAAHRYEVELSDLFTDEDLDEDYWHPDDPTSWDDDDYMEWELDRLMDKPD